jgi:hypothetical protein
MLVYVTTGEVGSGQVRTNHLRIGHEDELQFEAVMLMKAANAEMQKLMRTSRGKCVPCYNT